MNMLFFRSEDALDKWLTSKNARRGAVFSIPQLWKLSQRWYQDRMSAEYHGRTMEQAQEIFKEAGLTSDFWHAA
jgi:hypothetical protein